MDKPHLVKGELKQNPWEWDTGIDIFFKKPLGNSALRPSLQSFLVNI